MIIIKSQDGKRIKKCTDIQSSSTHIYGSGEIALNDQELVGESLMGIYTEERAKEVMLDIEYHIEKYYDSKPIIFKMPKE